MTPMTPHPQTIMRGDWDYAYFNGMIGYVIETYYDGKYEVEFSDSEGISLVQIVVD